MPNARELQQEIQSILQLMQPCVQRASDLTWDPSDGFLPVIFRAVLVRQFDSLGAISDLVANDKGFAAPALLRTSCEELIWTKYLASIDAVDADQLIVCIASNELWENLKVQDDYGGRRVTEQLGLLPYLSEASGRRTAIQDKLKTLGCKLSWPHRQIEHGELPRVKWLAQKTGQIRAYNFIYHATSRHVHFSGGELLRHAWVGRGGTSIRSIHFRGYWASFAMYWGLRLFLDSAIEIYGVFPDIAKEGLDEDGLLAAAARVGEFGQVPIITAEELAWPEGGLPRAR